MIVDSNILIAAERRGDALDQAILRIREIHGDQLCALSSISIIELTHGIHRGRFPEHRERRRVFVDEICKGMTVYPVTLEIAQLAGRIEGEQAQRGFAIPFEDLIIGSTALYLGFDVLTLNLRHFQLIPGLKAFCPLSPSRKSVLLSFSLPQSGARLDSLSVAK